MLRRTNTICIWVALCALATPFPLLGVAEENLSEFDEKIQEHLDERRIEGKTFTSADGVEVGYLERPGEGFPIVFVTGLGETYRHYSELLFDLKWVTRPIYVIELRGQGHGERLGARPQVMHLEKLEDYYADLDFFINEIIQERQVEAIVATSTGAIPTIFYASAKATRKYVRQIVLVAPLIELRAPQYIPNWVSWLSSVLMTWAGYRDDYVMMHSDYEPKSKRFEGNGLTHSRARFERIFRIPNENMKVRSGGPSNGWLGEVVGRLPKVLMDRASSIRIPTKIVSAGSDTYVSTPAQTKFCNKVPKCDQVVITGSRHVIHHESDTYRDQYYRFLVKLLPGEQELIP